MVNSSKGWRGCNDYEGWGRIIGKLATNYPMVKVVNIDDFSSNVPQVFTDSYIKAIKAGLSEGGVSLIPTFYYPGVHLPWLLKATDGALFYFRNDKEGQAQCGQPSAAGGGLCTPPSSKVTDLTGDGGLGGGSKPTMATIPCTKCCLSGARAELSLKNIGSEISDFAEALPPGHPLHVGLYNSRYSHCATPSAAYTRESLMAALGNPAVAGATVYTTQIPHEACLPPGELNNETDKGCIVRSIFANYTAAVVNAK